MSYLNMYPINCKNENMLAYFQGTYRKGCLHLHGDFKMVFSVGYVHLKRLECTDTIEKENSEDWY